MALRDPNAPFGSETKINLIETLTFKAVMSLNWYYCPNTSYIIAKGAVQR